MLKALGMFVLLLLVLVAQAADIDAGNATYR